MPSKPTDIRILSAKLTTESLAYRTPIKFGGRVVTAATTVDVYIEVETRQGRRARGHGSMPMSNAWGWPSQKVSGEETLAAMIDFAERTVADANAYHEHGHPLDITHHLAQNHAQLAEQTLKAKKLAEPIPRLAQLVAASPVEAAIHDAQGKALGINSYNLLGAEFCNHDIGHYLGAEFNGEFLDRYTLRRPKPRMPLYHLVGALDPLTPGDVEKPVGDGLPETLGQWIKADGLTHMKIKLNGDDLNWDVDRVVRIENVAIEAQAERGCKSWNYSTDFNEKCANVQYVLDFLARVKERSPSAWERIQYIEQPTSRNLKANPDNKMHAAAKIKPVVIDEALVDFESLLICREQGYSGVALKACKGQTEALLMGAAAQKFGMFLCVQDLTCPGASFLHSASLSARIGTVAAIEGNSRQYCPVGNNGWRERFPTMFRVADGTLGTYVLDGPGLGY